MKINHSFQINSLLKRTLPHFLENFFAEVKIKNDQNHFWIENAYEYNLNLLNQSKHVFNDM